MPLPAALRGSATLHAPTRALRRAQSVVQMALRARHLHSVRDAAQHACADVHCFQTAYPLVEETFRWQTRCVSRWRPACLRAAFCWHVPVQRNAMSCLAQASLIRHHVPPLRIRLYKRARACRLPPGTSYYVPRALPKASRWTVIPMAVVSQDMAALHCYHACSGVGQQRAGASRQEATCLQVGQV